jgi:inner membrane protein
MDPLAHTLAGASLAHSGLKRFTPLATATLVIGANLPDVDIVANSWGADASLLFRRGCTHGVLAMLLWPPVLAGAMLLFDLVRRRLRPGAEPARARALVWLSVLGVWSHPALDWMNTYGVRLLMPFSERWFYGDALFIIDPWLWLLLAAGVVVATAGWLGTLGWALLGSAATFVVVSAEQVPPPARICWAIGVAAIAGARFAGERARARVLQITRWCLVSAAVYVTLMVLGTRIASAYARQWLEGETITYRSLMSGPVPANPAIREVVVTREDRYSFLEVNVITGRVQPGGRDVPINGPTTITQAALDAPQVRGLRNWIRLPSYYVEHHPDGYRVHIRDVRYQRLGERASGVGATVVELDAALRPR